jgi:hypothetical protein
MTTTKRRLAVVAAVALIATGTGLAMVAVDDVASIEGWLPSVMLVGLVPLLAGLSLIGPRPARLYRPKA